MNKAVEKSITVQCSLEHAFRVFTDQIHIWWPASHRMSRDARSSMILEPREGGALYSVDPEGGRKSFGNIRCWEPPNRLVFSWALGAGEKLETEVEIRFHRQAHATRVDLVHRELLSRDDAWRETSPGFERAWAVVLPAFEDFIRQAGVAS